MPNMGLVDRLIRIWLAILMVFFAWTWESWLALALACFILYEAFTGWSVIYQLLGINTRSSRKP